MDARSPDRLTRLFASLLAPLAVGCGDRIDESQFSERLCGEAGPAVLDFVEPDEAVDYLELRTAEDQSWGEEEGQWNVYVEESSGTRCGGASDATLCNESFDALPLESDFYAGFEYPAYQSLAWTRGDRVGSAGSGEQLRSFLGSVDAPGDAALLATLGSSHRLNCGADNQSARPAAATWSTRARAGAAARETTSPRTWCGCERTGSSR